MDFMRRIVRPAVVVVVVVAGSGSQPAQAQEAAPTITVEPATDLADVQQISVTGTGFPAQQWVRMAECPADGAAADESCAWLSFFRSTEDGQFSMSVPVRAIVRDAAGNETDCREPDACVLAAFVLDEGSGRPVEATRTPLHFDPEAPVAPPPLLSVTSSGDLVDGQTVSVQGSGFMRDRELSLVQCAPGPIAWDNCDDTTSAFVELSDGAFATEARVFTILSTSDSGVVDCRVAECSLAGIGLDESGDSAATPLVFDPDGPLLPPPTLTVTPGRDLVDGQLVQVDGSGFDRFTSVSLAQCAPDPVGDRCRTGREWVDVAADGTFSSPLTVTGRVATPEGPVDCRTSPRPCLVVAHQAFGDRVAGQADLAFDPDGPLLPDPTVGVEPAADLGDFTSVSVQGSKFTPGEMARVEVCTAGAPRICDWGSSEEPTADAEGNIALDLAVYTTFDDELGQVDCRVAPGCVLSATDRARGVTVEMPLAFGPADPPGGRYRDPVFTDVEVIRDVVYRHTTDYRGNPIDLAVDIYRPAGDTATSRPAVIWMYGGWFKFGDKSAAYVVDYATEWAKRGYVAVALNYRIRPDLDISDLGQVVLAALDAYDDAVAGAGWLQDHAAEYGIDPDAISATGWSAGAVTSLAMAYIPPVRGPQESPIAAAMPLAGELLTDIDAGEPPSLVFRAGNDTTLPINNSDTVCPRAAAVDVACEYVNYEGDSHGIPFSRDRDILRRSGDFLSEVVLDPLGYFDLAASAGGPYTVDEGSSVVLDGSRSSGSGLSYAWSPADRVDDPTAVAPTLVGWDDGTETVGLTVTNTHGITAGATAEVTTRNVAPTIPTAALAGSPGGSTSALDATVADPGIADTHTATVDWGDGVVEPVPVDQGRIRADHDYASGGTYSVTLTVADDDGGAATWSGSALVGCTVTGHEGGDVLLGTPGDDVICGLGGNDVVLGLGGNDTILGGPGNDVLLGGAGDDVLDGESGFDLVIGGSGRNTCTAEIRLSCGRRR